MSQLSVNGTNPNPLNSIGNNDINDNDGLKSIGEGLKENIEDATSLNKSEQLKPGGRTAPKPESTMHKVGRFLTGILGGLLLAAGVAAAVAATVATCGLAGGIIAGVAATVVGTVGGTAATAVIAGAAGSAGIALITGSHVMKPRNPEALLQTQGKAGANEIINEDKSQNDALNVKQEVIIPNEDKSRNDALNVKQEVIIPGNGLMDDLLQGQNLNVVSMNPQPPQDKTIFAEGEEGKILHELKTSDPNFDGKVKPSFDDAADVFDGYSKSAGWISSLSEYPIDSFVDSVMRKNGVTDSSAQSILQKNPANPNDLLTRKNVLIMRHAIIQYFNKFPAQRNGVRDVLNSAEGRQQFDNAMEGLINKAKTPEAKARLQIFRVAMTKDEDAIQ